SGPSADDQAADQRGRPAMVGGEGQVPPERPGAGGGGEKGVRRKRHPRGKEERGQQAQQRQPAKEKNAPSAGNHCCLRERCARTEYPARTNTTAATRRPAPAAARGQGLYSKACR